MKGIRYPRTGGGVIGSVIYDAKVKRRLGRQTGTTKTIPEIDWDEM